MPRGKRVWRRRWYYVDYDTERGLKHLAEELWCAAPDVLHAVVALVCHSEFPADTLLAFLPETRFHKGDETDGPTEGD